MGESALETVCPLVTIVVPVYSGLRSLPELLRRCESLRQGLGDVPKGLLHEVIFVCDEPMDGSDAFLLEQARHKGWVQVVSLARNGGQHLATAVGILYSSGDWILTIDEDLQHPLELVTQVLSEALHHGMDLIYVKSTTRVHASSIYRDMTSNASRICMKLFTREDYSIISSFRMIRGEVGRAIAISIDERSYLDASLFSVTSARRRSVFYATLSDHRVAGGSGYSIKKLLRHFGRLIMSAEFSGLRMMTTLGLVIGVPLLVLMTLLLVLGSLQGTRQIAPGWLSLFFLGVTTISMLMVYAVYSLKLLSVLFLRSSGSPQFLVVRRELDQSHLDWLRTRS